MDNLGGFEKLFPIEIPDELEDNKKTELVQKRALYEQIRAGAKDLFDNQFGVKNSRKAPEMQPV